MRACAFSDARLLVKVGHRCVEGIVAGVEIHLVRVWPRSHKVADRRGRHRCCCHSSAVSQNVRVHSERFPAVNRLSIRDAMCKCTERSVGLATRTERGHANATRARDASRCDIYERVLAKASLWQSVTLLNAAALRRSQGRQPRSQSERERSAYDTTSKGLEGASSERPFKRDVFGSPPALCLAKDLWELRRVLDKLFCERQVCSAFRVSKQLRSRPRGTHQCRPGEGAFGAH